MDEQETQSVEVESTEVNDADARREAALAALADIPAPEDDDSEVLTDPEEIADKALAQKAKEDPRARAMKVADDAIAEVLGADGKPVAETPTETQSSEFEERAQKLQKILERRDSQITQKQAAARQMAEQQAALQQQQAEIRAERERIDREKAYLSLLKRDPARAIKESGMRPEEFLLSLAEEDGPDAQLRKRLQEQEDQLSQLKQWREEQAQQREAYERRAAEERDQHARTTVVQAFTSLALNPEVSPHLASMYEDNPGALIFEGDQVAYQYRKETGQEIDLEDIVTLLEYRAQQRYNRVASKKHASTPSQAAPSVQTVTKPQTVAKPRTITAEVASERRMSTKDLMNLSDEERREHAIRVADAVQRKSK